MNSPDFEALLVAYLKPLTTGARVVTKTPRTTATPWVRITLLDDVPYAPSTALHLFTGTLQLDCYGGSTDDDGHAAASALARSVRASLNLMPRVDHGDAVVTRVKSAGGIRRLPDQDFSPARERFTFDVDVSAHPKES